MGLPLLVNSGMPFAATNHKTDFQSEMRQNDQPL
jgi:hypothetical protein